VPCPNSVSGEVLGTSGVDGGVNGWLNLSAGRRRLSAQECPVWCIAGLAPARWQLATNPVVVTLMGTGALGCDNHGVGRAPRPGAESGTLTTKQAGLPDTPENNFILKCSQVSWLK
jgi:hypothetical protein